MRTQEELDRIFDRRKKKLAELVSGARWNWNEYKKAKCKEDKIWFFEQMCECTRLAIRQHRSNQECFRRLIEDN